MNVSKTIIIAAFALHCGLAIGRALKEKPAAHARAASRALTASLNFSTLAASQFHSCGLLSDGVAYCWGDPYSFRLGAGAGVSGDVPVPVDTWALQPGGLRFTSISPAPIHTCAVATTGYAYCWGYGGFGALGQNDTNTYATPAQVLGLGVVAQLSSKFRHTCA